MWMGRSITMAAPRLVTPSTSVQTQMLLFIWKVDGRPLSLKALAEWRISPLQNWEKNSRKPIKNTRTSDTRLGPTHGTKVVYLFLLRVNVSHGQNSTKTRRSSFLKSKDDCENVAWQSANLKSKGVSGVHHRPCYPRLSVC